LVAQLGTEALNILKDRRPIEYLVRIVAQPKASIPKEEIKTEAGEKSLVELIKEMGGSVE
jgi:predicted secreted protein